MTAIKFASIIVTYRCNARCHMCNTWQHPSKKDEEVGIAVYEKLPPMQTEIRGFLMADTAYYYPEDRSISESIRVGRQLADAAVAGAT